MHAPRSTLHRAAICGEAALHPAQRRRVTATQSGRSQQRSVLIRRERLIVPCKALAQLSAAGCGRDRRSTPCAPLVLDERAGQSVLGAEPSRRAALQLRYEKVKTTSPGACALGSSPISSAAADSPYISLEKRPCRARTCVPGAPSRSHGICVPRPLECARTVRWRPASLVLGQALIFKDRLCRLRP